MPSRLSSLLVRDGLVGVKRMEKAYQRQVIYGGSLDTILLEMNLVPEERLTQYLALASGLPPAARDEAASISPEALAVIPRELAQKYRALPLAVEGETVRILVCSPLEITELEDLADQLDRPLQPLITPEYRWHLAFAEAYQLDPPARFTTLSRALEADAAMPPVGRARTIIIEDRVVGDLDDGDSSGIPVGVYSGELTERTPLAETTKKTPTTLPRTSPPSRPPRTTARRPSAAEWQTPEATREGAHARGVSGLAHPPAGSGPHAANEAHGRDRRHTMVGVTPHRARDTDPGAFIAPRPPADGVPAEPIAKPEISFTAAPGSGGIPQLVDSSTTTRRQPRAQTAPIATEGRDTPLPIVTAREMLATAEDRDTVFLTLLRAARSRARWAGLLTVQGGAAIGRVALAEPGLDAQAIQTVLIPLDAMSPFRAVVANHQPHIGPLVSGDPGVDSMVLRMGGTMPPSALLLPIVIRDRVVALVVAHRVHSDLRLADVTELLPMANAASEALGRLIVKSKSAGYRAPTVQPVVEVEPQLVDAKKGATTDGPWAAPAERPSVAGLEPSPGAGLDIAVTAAPPRRMEDVIDAIERAPEGGAESELAEAVERAPEALFELNRRFPGTLRIDRFAVAGRPLRASQYGGLLELVVRLGSAASELLIEKMAAAQRDVRFYAVVCASELRPRNAVYALAERLFDQDFGVRATAIEALAGYPLQDLGTALARARRAVHSSDPEVVGAAATALVSLGDTDAVPDLIGVVERADRAGEHARRALVALTAQDFGASERRWRKWYESAKRRHRIEWLIDGLVHKEDAVREIAINDLRRLTGEYFGYHHDLPRRERDSAAQRWVAWWRDVGHRRFVQREDERQRPTGILPSRHEPS